MPVVAVSYDRAELAIEDQIVAKHEASDPRLGSAFLLKPRIADRPTIESIAELAPLLRLIDIVGVLEKEAGDTFLERLIFRLRAARRERGLQAHPRLRRARSLHDASIVWQEPTSWTRCQTTKI